MENKLRAVNLYRASSKQQTDKEHDFDIPLQKQILREYVASSGWELVKEFTEGGVSGYKVSANDRDAIQEILKMAARKEFDILVIYMSDRLGRIADETPLIVQLLNKHGVKIMSYVDGEIKSDTHVDKLITYIKYWQAEGESLKTSIRVGDAITDKVKRGEWRGGNFAYGYRGVYKGTLNFKGKPIMDVEIIPEQAEVVKEIFRLAREENYGLRRIAEYLNDRKIPTQKGGQWMSSTVKQILNNRIYKGEYVLYGQKSDPKAISPIMENMIIIPREEWDETQEAMEKRATRTKGIINTTHGKLLLSGLAFCGTCGRKMITQGQKSKYTKKNGEFTYHKHYKYMCSSFAYPTTEKCAGQTTFSAKKIEAEVIADVKEYLGSLNCTDVISAYKERVEKEIKEKRATIGKVRATLPKLEKEVAAVKEEVVKSIMGESAFGSDLLKEMLQKREIELKSAKEQIVELEEEIGAQEKQLHAFVTIDDELKNWSEKFDEQTYEGKKAMLIKIIDKVLLFSDRIEIIYNIKLRSYIEEFLDTESCTQGALRQLRAELFIIVAGS